VNTRRASGRSASAVAAAALGGLAGLSLAATLPLSLLSRQIGNGIVAVVIGVPCAAVGVVVARRQPRNPLGWLFLLTAVFLLVSNDGGDYSFFVYRLGHHIPLGPAALALDPVWTLGLVLLVAMIQLFPDGRLPSRASRWAMRVFWAVYAVLLAAMAAVTASALAAHPVSVDVNGGLSAVDNSTGWFEVLKRPVFLLILAMALGFILRQILSWRRSSGERRQQLKWLASGAAVTIVSVVVGVALSSTGPTPAWREWVDNIAWFGLAALPVSMGVAIMRYRLYEIDRIISRTLAYTVVTGLLIAAYAGLVLLSTDVLGLSSSVAVAASTLAAAAAFSPMRRRCSRPGSRMRWTWTRSGPTWRAW
jgi:two-component system, NarL family, sensor kinase